MRDTVNVETRFSLTALDCPRNSRRVVFSGLKDGISVSTPWGIFRVALAVFLFPPYARLWTWG